MNFDNPDYDKTDYGLLKQEYAGATNKTREDYTSDQQAAIAAYAGSGYKWLNRYLRTDDQESLAGGRVQSLATLGTAITWQRMADLLNEAMNQTTTTRDTVAFRGVRKGAIPPLQVGDEITDHGFISTSLDPGEASAFGWDDPGATVFHVSVPRGTNALPGAKEEHELLLRPGTTMRVVAIEGVFTKVVLV